MSRPRRKHVLKQLDIAKTVCKQKAGKAREEVNPGLAAEYEAMAADKIYLINLVKADVALTEEQKRQKKKTLLKEKIRNHEWSCTCKDCLAYRKL